MAEIIFVIEPDTGRITIESSNATGAVERELHKDLGLGTALNCARPNLETEPKIPLPIVAQSQTSRLDQIYLYRIYHYSTVDGPGRRSVIQVAGCSIRCPGCYVPETHERTNGKLILIDDIVSEVEKRSGEHDGVTILGGEPFDQLEHLEILVNSLKSKGFHLVIYTGFTLESLVARKSESVQRILAKTDLLIDGPFDRTLTQNAGEYRGSANQRLIFYPILRRKS
ncbi:MAG TPA: 4Fe-4S single cluster domain-containing protein [Pyrinomonadaceae bacterium]|nr:4Fe-4S single cluster domain-containing protein [Pyrinomonadaceae bacterium]